MHIQSRFLNILQKYFAQPLPVYPVDFCTLKGYNILLKGYDDMAKQNDKTNVMRILEQKKAEYTSHSYIDTDAISGVEVAQVLGEDPNRVFKTLVTQGASKIYYVFLVPVHRELDLKKGAKTVGEKSIAMIKAKELLPLTGYIHGGCSPVGMKKQFRTTIDISAENFETIFFSAGKIGYQVETTLTELKKVIPFDLADIVC